MKTLIIIALLLIAFVLWLRHETRNAPILNDDDPEHPYWEKTEVEGKTYWKKIFSQKI